MRRNLIIILLTAAVTILAVNVMMGNYPPIARAATDSNRWIMECNSNDCFAIDPQGRAFYLSIASMRELKVKK